MHWHTRVDFLSSTDMVFLGKKRDGDFWGGSLVYHMNKSCEVVGSGFAGYLLDATHSWSQVYGLAAAVYAIGYGGFFAFGSAEKQFE